VRATFRFPPWAILGTGLGVSVMTALVPLVAGSSVLEHSLFDETLPLLGKVKATSALPFDIGVYMVVIGLVLMAFEAFGDDVEPDEGADDDATPERPRTGAPIEEGVGA
jgi:multicomponent Na+:H+ antiporter subunit A